METFQEQMNVPSTSFTSSSCSDKNGDESSDEGLPMPPSLIGAENYLTLTEGKLCALSKEELAEAISKCKLLIVNSDVCSDERKWLVRRLVDLRYQLLTVEELQKDSNNCNENISSRIVLGHHFNSRYEPTSTTKRYCDTCCSTIWNVVQAWYQCADCRYRCHTVCVDQIIRPCPHLITSENESYETRICPEIGLAAQDYQCAECKLTISFKKSWISPRLCDYTGLYYCKSCHWNNLTVIPARVVRNWDFKPYFVCRATYQMLKFTQNRAIIRLDPRLYGLVVELARVKRFREVFSLMKPYLVQCRVAKLERKLLWKQFGMRSHLLQPSEIFSLRDLVDINNQTLVESMKDLTSKFTSHITKDCMICRAQGYRCELCEEKNDVFFPFSNNVYICPECSWVYHKTCWVRHPKCTKCERRSRRLETTDNEGLQ